MRFIRSFLAIIGLFFLLILAMVTPIVWLTVILYLFGIYQVRQKRRVKETFSKPGWIITAAIALSFILSMVFTEPTQEMADDKVEEQMKSEEIKQQVEKEQAAAELKAIEEEKAKQAEKEKQESEQKQKQEELVNKFNLEKVVVARVIDGDTIELKDGTRVRLIGVNTPESTTRTEEYGKEASNYTVSTLSGKTVWLQKDVSEKDRYNRLLRVIWLAIPTDDQNENEIRQKMFNAHLVLNGYAEPATYPPDVKYSDYFVKFAREARENNKGLWAFGENGTTKGDLDPKQDTTTENKPKPSTTNEETKAPEPNTAGEHFKNCTELRKKYPNGVSSDHPAYASKHDRDKDKWACER